MYRPSPYAASRTRLSKLAMVVADGAVVMCVFTIHPPGSLPADASKAKRVVDRHFRFPPANSLLCHFDADGTISTIHLEPHRIEAVQSNSD